VTSLYWVTLDFDFGMDDPLCGDSAANIFLVDYHIKSTKDPAVDKTDIQVVRNTHFVPRPISLNDISASCAQESVVRQNTNMTKGVLWVSSRVINPGELSADKFCDWYENVHSTTSSLIPQMLIFNRYISNKSSDSTVSPALFAMRPCNPSLPRTQ
jgi:hypothetical protein